MKSNNRILQIGVSLVILIMVACIGFTYYIRLKSPVFLRYCVEVPVPGQNGIPTSQPILQLEYITNATDKNTVVGITFPEAPEISFIATENNSNGLFFIYNTTQPTLGVNHGKYSVRTVYIYMNNFFHEEWLGECELHKAELQFSNGDRMTTDLGEIILYSDKDNSNDSITMNSSSTSSDGSSSSVYDLKDKIDLLHVKSKAVDSAKDLLDLNFSSVNYKDLSELDSEKSGILKIESKFADINGSKSSYDVYDLRPRVYYESPDGTTDYFRIYNISQSRQFYSFTALVFYLKERGIF